MWPALLRAARAAVALVSHTILAALVIVAIKLLETLVHFFWNHSEPLLFDRFPLRYLFHAMDGAVLIVFSVFGVLEAVRAFRETV